MPTLTAAQFQPYELELEPCGLRLLATVCFWTCRRRAESKRGWCTATDVRRSCSVRGLGWCYTALRALAMQECRSAADGDASERWRRACSGSQRTDRRTDGQTDRQQGGRQADRRELGHGALVLGFLREPAAAALAWTGRDRREGARESARAGAGAREEERTRRSCQQMLFSSSSGGNGDGDAGSSSSSRRGGLSLSSLHPTGPFAA